jgi:hypothetical protein
MEVTNAARKPNAISKPYQKVFRATVVVLLEGFVCMLDFQGLRKGVLLAGAGNTVPV